MLAAPDYKAMYLELFRANERAARLLWEAQQRAEQQLLDESPPPLHLPFPSGETASHSEDGEGR